MPRLSREIRTGIFTWVVAILCALITVAVIITGFVVFIGYIIIRPKVPDISVTRAVLDLLNFDQAGVLVVKITISINAENGNLKADASFYDTSFILGFHGVDVANLRADDPINVSKNSSIELKFEVESSPIPLGPEAQNEVFLSLSHHSIVFELKGTARTRWRVGLLGSVKFRLALDCRLQFPNIGDVIYPNCRTRSK